MQVVPTALPDVLLLEPKVFGDERGFFCETFNQRDFDAAVGRHVQFLQDNHSRSGRDVLRGLHFQRAPHAQAKLVRVVSGSVFDVAVDLRDGSATFGRWVGVELSESNRRQLWIPEGFAHGFMVTSDSADFLYKTTDYYAPQFERVVRYDDPDIGVRWPAPKKAYVLSDKDRAGGALARCKRA